MKKLIAILVVAITFTFTAQAQDKMMKHEKTTTISLEQTKGEFVQKGLTVSAGDYVFEVTNNYAGTDVGLVLVPKGKDASNEANHVKTAYVTEIVKEGATQKSNVTTLAKGEYVYFCPFNKTAQNTLTVQ